MNNDLSPMTVLQIVEMNDEGDSSHRMRWPAQWLAAQDPGLTVINLSAAAPNRVELAEQADLLVVFQSHDLELLEVTHRRRERRLATLVEYNDNFYEPPIGSPVEEAWRNPLIWSRYEQFIQAGDGLIVTGAGLRDLFAKRSSTPIHILENHLPFQPDPETLRQGASSSKIVVGWAGSVGHSADLLAMLPLLRRLAANHPDLEVHLMGSESFRSMIRIPDEQLHYVPWGSMDRYFEFWRGVDIALIPLLDTPYNSCRSDVKAVEAAACGAVPVVFSRRPYVEFLKQTELAPVQNFAQMESRVVGYLKDRKALRADASRCFEYVRASRYGPTRTERRELYRRSVRSRSERSIALQPGYHELTTTAPTDALEHRTIRELQALWKGGDRQQALDRLKDAIKQHPLSADLAVRLPRWLAVHGDPQQAAITAQEFARIFPDDLRFPLIRARICRDLSTWDEAAGYIERSPSTVRRFFQQDFVDLSLSLAESEILPLEAIAQLNSWYPHDPRVTFTAAMAYERSGHYAEAAELLSQVDQARESAAAGGEFLKNLNSSFVRGWLAALKARLEL